MPEGFKPLDQAAYAQLWALLQSIQQQADTDPISPTSSAAEIDRVLPNISSMGIAWETLLTQLQSLLLETTRKNAHPGLFSYILAPGLPTDPVAHALTAQLNQNQVGFHAAPLATQIERKLIGFFADLVGFPTEAGGLCMSGGSSANLSALTLALYHSLGLEIMQNGLRAASVQPVIIAATSAHFSIERAALILGIGRQNLYRVAVDAQQRMCITSLKQCLEQLSQKTHKKAVCVVATAGSTAAGAIDPLADIADLCQHYGVWMHVDAAYGGAFLLSTQLKSRFQGIEAADSISIDLHKSAYLALETNILLYRQVYLAKQVFSADADYLAFDELKEEAEHYTSFDLSFEVSRRFRALPAYLALLHYGTDNFAEQLKQNIACADYLSQQVKAAPDFELLFSPQLAICCFRFAPLYLAPEKIDEINTQIVHALNANGHFSLSETLIQKRPVLRVCIRSYTTKKIHIDDLLVQVRRLGLQFSASTNLA